MRYSLVIGARLGLAVGLSALVSGSAVAGEWGGSPPRQAPTKLVVMEPLIYIDRVRLSVSVSRVPHGSDARR